MIISFDASIGNSQGLRLNVGTEYLSHADAMFNIETNGLAGLVGVETQLHGSAHHLKQLTINVVNKLHQIDLGCLGERFYDNLLVLRLCPQFANRLCRDSFFLINFGNPIGNYIFKDGILFNITGEYYGILEVNMKKSKLGLNFNLSSNENFAIDSLVDNDVHTETVESPQEDDKIFSMKPPSSMSRSSSVSSSLRVSAPTALTVSPQHINDPLDYLKSKYYSILYSPSTPLSYFSKTALPRLKILCKDNNDTLKSTLLKIFCLINHLNIRHDGNFGVLKRLQNSVETLDLQYEVSNQINFLTSNNLLKESDSGEPNSSLYHFTSILKLREFQLQLIVLLELLTTLGINESDFLYNNSPQPEINNNIVSTMGLDTASSNSVPKSGSEVNSKGKSRSKTRSRPALVRKKNLARKVIPTFLGMGIPITQEPQHGKDDTSRDLKTHGDVNSVNTFSLLQTLNNLIERLSLWDTLFNNKQNNSLSFIAYVLVPYYKSRLPLTIKYLVERIKGLNLKLRSSKSVSSSSNSKSKSKDREREKEKLKQKKFDRPKLNDFNSLDDKTFAPSLTLRKSNSNLSSKHLHRRQVDFSNPSHSQSQSSSQGPSISRSQSQVSNGSLTLSDPHSVAARLKSLSGLDRTSIFSQSKRLNPSKTTVTSSKSFSQVAATPVKKPQTNLNPREIVSPELDKSPIDSPIVMKKPNTNIILSPSGQKGSTPSFQILQASHSSHLSPVTETPNKQMSRSGNFLMSPAQIESSPMIIVSSERKRKPGDPIDFQNPSFYKALNGSPSNNDTNSGSIFKRATKRKKK